jgi:hypothetical protein
MRRVRRLVTHTPPTAPCPDCGRDVVLVTPTDAAWILESDGRSLDELIAAGVVHTLSTVTGTRWICRDSLFQRLP